MTRDARIYLPADAAVKFGVTLKTLNAALGRARSVGNIETVTLIRAKR